MIDLLREQENNELAHRFPGRSFTGQKLIENTSEVETSSRSKSVVSSSHDDNLRRISTIGFLRFYYPILGRWVSRDPIGAKGGLNLYVDLNNNPISKSDYLGLFDWNSVNKATEIYSKLHDDGAEFARELMIYYVIGGGKPFLRGQYYIVDTIMDHGNPNDSAWAKFMKSRAEISVRMNQFYNTLAEELRHNFNLKGDFNKNALNIELTQESMLLTLHGSRGIKVRGQFEKCCKNSICKIIFQKVTWSWIDGIGDKELLQPGNSTLLNSGEVVPDSLFLKIGIGQTYPIVIQWTDDNVSIPK